MRCDKCEAEISVLVIRTCWEDRYTPDHRGICCSCFDVSCGKRPPVVLGLKTVARLDDDSDDDAPMA